MYVNGLNPKVQALYPPMKFPVSRGTPSIPANLPFWDHNEQWTPIAVRNAFVSLIFTEKATNVRFSWTKNYYYSYSFVLFILDPWRTWRKSNYDNAERQCPLD